MTCLLGWLPFLVAAAVLTGWQFDNEILRRLGLASVTMSPTTACGFLLLSCGVACRDTGRKPAMLIASVLFGLTGLIGGLKLLDIVAGTHFNIDTYLFASKLSLGYVRPSRMAPNTAACFIICSLALQLMTHRGERAVILAQVLAFATLLVGTFALVGLLYGVGAFYIVAAFHPMALHAAASFLCLSAFVLIRTANRGLVAPISDTGPAGRTSRGLLPAAVIVPVAFGWLRQRGESAGLYPADIGIALMVMMTMLTFTALIWHNAKLLLRADSLRLHAEATIAHMASHDFLTGLPNRRSFMDRLQERVTQSPPGPGHGFAIICMDLDGFKQVNDRLGHAAGDALLRDVGRHLRQCSLRQGDVVARIGGDEFAMLLGQVSQADDAFDVARRIVEDMPKRVGAAGDQSPIGISVGIVIANGEYTTPDALLANADQALYDAKRTGKGRFVLHEVADQAAPARFETAAQQAA